MFCPNCGAQYDGNYCPNGCNSPHNAAPQAQPQKKKKGWQIALIVVGVIVAIGVVGGILGESGGSNKPDSASAAGASGSPVVSDAEEAAAEPAQQESSELSYEEEIATYQPIDYATLARNPDNYKDQKFVMTGEVIQVQEPTFGKTVQLRINVTKQTYEYIDSVTWTDTIYATVQIPDGGNRILDGDIITFYGTCDGLYTYTSVLGSSISLPKIDIKYWSLNE